MKSKNRRANKKVKRLCFMRDNQPAAYAEMIRAEVDELFRLAWSGTDFTPGSEAQPLALEKVRERVDRISDPGIRAGPDQGPWTRGPRSQI